MQTGDHRAKRVDRVRHRATIDPAVQVTVRPGHFHFHVAQPAQAGIDAGHIVGDHRGVADQYDVGLEALLVVLHELPQVVATHLLFALDHHLHVARQASVLDHRFHGLHVHVELAFVIRAPPGVDEPVLHHRIEGAAVPKVQWVRGLHIVVTINQHGRLGRVDDLLPINDRMSLGGAYFHLFQPGFLHTLFHGFSAPGDIGLVLGIGAHTGDAQEVQQFVQEALLLAFDVGVDRLHGALGLGAPKIARHP